MTAMTARILKLVGLLFAAALSLGCAKAPPHLTPEAKVSFHLRQVVVSINAMSQVARDAYDSGVISEDDTRQVVKATVKALEIADTLNDALQAGYTQEEGQRKALAALRAVLQDLPSHLSPKAYDLVAPYLQAVTSLLLIYGY